MSSLQDSSGLPDRMEVRSLSDYKRAAERQFEIEADGCFVIWPTQIEILRACETLAARVSHWLGGNPATHLASLIANRGRRRPGTTRADSGMVSFLTRCAEFVQPGAANGSNDCGLALLSRKLDETVSWLHPTEVRIQHADAFNGLFALANDWRTRGDPLAKARELMKLAHKVSVASVRKDAAAALVARDRLVSPAVDRVHSAMREQFCLCIAWQERPQGIGGPTQGKVEIVGVLRGEDKNAVLHQLAGLTAYSLQKSWARRRKWKEKHKDRPTEHHVRYTSIILRGWLEAAGEIGYDGEAGPLFKGALERLDQQRAKPIDDVLNVRGSAIAVLWQRRSNMPAETALTELNHLWAMRQIVEANYADQEMTGRVNRARWTHAMRREHGFDCLDPHEFWRAGW